MSKSQIPRLFAWGDDGLPGEFKIYLKGIGEDDGPSQVVFSRNGVVRVANKFRSLLEKEKEDFKVSKGHPPKLSHEIRSILYLLHAYCAHHKEPAPPELLWLTFKALDLQEQKPAREIEQLLGVPAAVEKMEAFFRASALDGAADAKGEDMSAAQLGRDVGVERATIRRWREDPLYKARRQFAAMAWTNAPGIYAARRNARNQRVTKGGNRKV